jgi:alpha-galactosidase
MVKKKFGIEKIDLKEVKVNVLGINHFTWFTEAKYKGMDLFPIYKEYVNKHPNGIEKEDCGHWANGVFETKEMVKFDLFKRFGVIAAAGDRHLAEFCPGAWYLHNPETVKKYGFALTPVSYRIEQLEELLAKSEELYNGKPFELYETGEESVQQIRSLLGLEEFVTNVNIPNVGQMPDMPIGAIVETNAYFSGDSVRPVTAGKLPLEVNTLVERVVEEQETVVEAALTNDYEMAFKAFINNPNVCIPIEAARALFDEMLYNTRAYLPGYEAYVSSRPKSGN